LQGEIEALPPYLEDRKITQTADVKERPTYYHPDRRLIPDSEVFKGKVNDRPPGKTGAIPSGYSGRVALKGAV